MVFLWEPTQGVNGEDLGATILFSSLLDIELLSSEILWISTRCQPSPTNSEVESPLKQIASGFRLVGFTRTGC